MSDFLNDMQCDELVDGQYYNGEYVPTDQDLADMNEAWDLDNLDFNEVMGYDKGEQFFCANCGHIELTYSQSPDSSLCCDCYKYNNDNDDYYIETESDVYQDAFYDDYPEMDW